MREMDAVKFQCLRNLGTRVYLNGVIVAGGDKHLGVARIECNTIDDIGVLIFGQTDAIISVPNVCVHIFSTAEKEMGQKH